jgi:hypothetical protein
MDKSACQYVRKLIDEQLHDLDPFECALGDGYGLAPAVAHHKAGRATGEHLPYLCQATAAKATHSDCRLVAVVLRYGPANAKSVKKD